MLFLNIVSQEKTVNNGVEFSIRNSFFFFHCVSSVNWNYLVGSLPINYYKISDRLQIRLQILCTKLKLKFWIQYSNACVSF